MIHFATSALAVVPHWASEGDEAVGRVVDGEAAAVCSVSSDEFRTLQRRREPERINAMDSRFRGNDE